VVGQALVSRVWFDVRLSSVRAHVHGIRTQPNFNVVLLHFIQVEGISSFKNIDGLAV
jgi:hypothetical protein